MNKLIGLLLLLAGAVIIFTIWIKSAGGKITPLPGSFDPYKTPTEATDQTQQGGFNEAPDVFLTEPTYNILFEAPDMPTPPSNADDFKKMYDENVKKSLNSIEREILFWDPSPPPPGPTLQEMEKGETSFTTRTGGGELDKWIGGR